MHFVDNRPAYDRLLVHADHPNMRAMLRLLGLKVWPCTTSSKAYHFESIEVFRQPRQEFFVGPEARAVFARLREGVAGSVVVPSARHIYAGRANAGQSRWAATGPWRTNAR